MNLRALVKNVQGQHYSIVVYNTVPTALTGLTSPELPQPVGIGHYRHR